MSIRAGVSEIAGVPAVTEDGAEGICALFEVGCDVVGAVVDSGFVICPAGGEEVFGDSFVIDGEVDKP